VSFSQGEFDQAEGRVAFLREWERLKDSLNNIPKGAQKTTAQWKTVSILNIYIKHNPFMFSKQLMLLIKILT